MKYSAPLSITGAIISVGLLTSVTTDAAYIIATDGTLGAGNYAYTGPGGIAATASAASTGNLPAFTDAPQTFFTLGHVYGGDGTTDEYTFTYSPATDGDNTGFAAGTLFNGLGAAPDLTSSGLSNGAAGFYNVYRLHPANPGVSGGPTTYQVQVNGGLELTQVIDQNAANLATGENIGRWELIGNVGLSNAADTLTVTMTPDTSSFVSMRASGIMLEYTGPVPEPGSTVLLGLGTLALLGRRRR